MNKLIACVMMTLTLFACTQTYAKNNTVRLPNHLMVSYLQTAKKATLSTVKQHKNTYQLTLYGVAPNFTYLSERPYRIAGTISNKLFLNKWNSGKNSFGADAPNAVLAGVTHATSKNQSVNYLFSLSTPVYDLTNHTITFQARDLNESTHHTINDKPLTVHDAVLIVDDACLTCVG